NRWGLEKLSTREVFVRKPARGGEVSPVVTVRSLGSSLLLRSPWPRGVSHTMRSFASDLLGSPPSLGNQTRPLPCSYPVCASVVRWVWSHPRVFVRESRSAPRSN